MSTIKIIDKTGAEVGKLEANADVFGIKPNVAVMHQVVRAQRASWRQGSASTKGRSDVRGGGRKPFKQKGSGRARQGTIRAAQMIGGGVVFGPHPRSYSFKVNKKEIKLAMRSALSSKLADNQLLVTRHDEIKEPKTRDAAQFLKNAKLDDKRVTCVINDDHINCYLSLRNLKNVNVIPVSAINTYDLIDNKMLLLEEDTVARIEEVLA